MTAAAVQHPDCDAFGCVGLPYCDYCGQLVETREARSVVIAARRLRRGDLIGALRVLQAAAQAPEPTGPVGTRTPTRTPTRSGDPR